MIFFVFLQLFRLKLKYGHKDLDPPAVKLMMSQLERDGTSQEVACVASVSSRGSSRKLGQEQKKT